MSFTDGEPDFSWEMNVVYFSPALEASSLLVMPVIFRAATSLGWPRVMCHRFALAVLVQDNP